MLTPDGLDDLQALVLGWVKGASVRVGESTEVFEDHAMDEGFPQLTPEGNVLVQATFGPTEGNLEWVRRSVVIDGKEVDVIVDSGGVKAAGTTWVLKHTMEPTNFSGD